MWERNLLWLSACRSGILPCESSWFWNQSLVIKDSCQCFFFTWPSVYSSGLCPSHWLKTFHWARFLDSNHELFTLPFAIIDLYHMPLGTCHNSHSGSQKKLTKLRNQTNKRYNHDMIHPLLKATLIGFRKTYLRFLVFRPNIQTGSWFRGYYLFCRRPTHTNIGKYRQKIQTTYISKYRMRISHRFWRWGKIGKNRDYRYIKIFYEDI